jgi:hypothetical protein
MRTVGRENDSWSGCPSHLVFIESSLLVELSTISAAFRSHVLSAKYLSI